MKLRTVTFEDFGTFCRQQTLSVRDDAARERLHEIIQQASPKARTVIDQVYMTERRQMFARKARGAVDREIVDQIVALIQEAVQ